MAFARRQELKIEAVDVQLLVQDMGDFLRQSVGPGVNIKVEIADDAYPVRADSNQLELALINLAVNARDAMPQGGTLTIECRNEVRDPRALPATLPDGKYVRLTVTDTGEGMDEATRSRALEPFFTTKGVGKGTGLGLSMVHGLTAQSGGAMDIASQSGQGTQVTLGFLARAATRLLSVYRNPARLRFCRRLVAQNPARGRRRVGEHEYRRMLADLGHDVLEASSAKHALQMLESESAFDALITDYAMPGMNGLELAMKVSATHPQTRVILATGYAELPTNSVVDFPRLSKPYTQQELSVVLDNAITNPGSAGV